MVFTEELVLEVGEEPAVVEQKKNSSDTLSIIQFNLLHNRMLPN